MKLVLGLGLGELIILLVIVLIIFGAGRLPELGESLGRGIRNFRKQLRMPDEIDVTPRNVEDEPSRPQDKDQP